MYSCNIGPFIYNKEISPHHYSPIDRALKCIYNFFLNKLPAYQFQELLERVNELVVGEKIPNSARLARNSLASIEKVDTDKFLTIALEYYQKLKNSYLDAISPELDTDTMLSLSDLKNLKSLKQEVLKISEEDLSKIFDSLAVSKKGDDNKIVKYMKLESFLSYCVDSNVILLEDF